MKDRFLALEASAGSGKTFAIAVRYIELFLSGANSSEILALTFTRKATAQMKERIIDTFLNLQDKEAEQLELAKALNIDKAKLSNQKTNPLIKLRDENLKRFLNSEIKIFTFDAFFSLILRSFALKFGINSNFLTVDDLSDIVKREFQKELEKDREALDEVVEYLYFDTNLDRFLITLEYFYSQMNFTKKSSPYPNLEHLNRSLKKLEGFLKNSISNLEIELSQATTKTAISDLSKTINQASKLIDELKQSPKELLGRPFIQRETLNYSTFKKIYEVDRSIDSLVGEIKEELRRYFNELEEYKLYKLSKVLDLYKRAKSNIYSRLNTLTFGDLSTLVFNLLSDEEVINTIYFRLDSRINHILIDEFQDTSVKQYQILKPLISEILAGYGQKGVGSFFYVGDIKQSIYRFRDGKKELFNILANEYKQIEKKNLDYNYRSYKAIVSFVNAVFKDKIDGYTIQKIPQNKDFKDTLQEDIEKNRALLKESKTNPYFNVEGDEYGYIKIQEVENAKENLLKEAVAKVEFLLENGASPEQIAILCWKNKEIDELSVLLKEKKIPFNSESSELLVCHPLVFAILEYARYLVTKEEIYKESLKRITGKTHKFITLDKKKSTMENINYIREQLGIGLEDSNVLKLIEIASEYKDISELAFSKIAVKKDESKEKGINLLTFHKSKGLEYNHVIICDKNSRDTADFNEFIYEYDSQNGWEIKLRVSGREFVDNSYKELSEKIALLNREELLNILYVGFTRAKKSLIILKSDNSSSLLSFKKDKEALLELEDFEFGMVLKDIISSKEEGGAQKKIELAKVERQKIKDLKEEPLDSNIHAINYGIALHYTLQMSGDFTKDLIEKAVQKSKSRYGKFLQEDDFADIKRRVFSLCDNVKFKELLNGSEIYKERSIKVGGKFIRLDLLLVKESEVIVVDYKSGLGFVEANQEQVSFYKEVLASFYKDKIIKAYIIRLLEDEVRINLV